MGASFFQLVCRSIILGIWLHHDPAQAGVLLSDGLVLFLLPADILGIRFQHMNPGDTNIQSVVVPLPGIWLEFVSALSSSRRKDKQHSQLSQSSLDLQPLLPRLYAVFLGAQLIWKGYLLSSGKLNFLEVCVLEKAKLKPC